MSIALEKKNKIKRFAGFLMDLRKNIVNFVLDFVVKKKAGIAAGSERPADNACN
ncbi:hypothetical protein ACOAOT_01725 [Lacrimispora sp. AGF001]|uniref:hypothetical protein n=1 Tax=Lacrimispora sp. AGF001 TaxID=3401631 RepID=UPI003B438EB7